MGSGIRGVLAVAISAASFGAHAIASEWSVVDLTPGTMGRAEAISQNGTVVGCYTVDNMPRAFVYANGQRRDLQTPEGSSSCASAVNNAGLIAGTIDGEITVWESGNSHRLGVKGNAAAMNEAGVIVGSINVDPPNVTGTAASRAFMYANGTFTDLGSINGAVNNWANAINNRNQVVGSSGGKAFIYENGAMRELSATGFAASARGINDRGEVVGGGSFGHGPEPFFYDGTLRPIGGWSYASAVGLNNVGQVLGSGEGIYGYLIEGDQTVVLDKLMGAPWHHSEPAAINDRGWIVGQGGSPDFHAFLMMPKESSVAASGVNPMLRPATRSHALVQARNLSP